MSNENIVNLAKEFLRTDEYALYNKEAIENIGHWKNLYYRLAEGALEARKTIKTIPELSKALHQLEQKDCDVEIDFGEYNDHYETWAKIALNQ